MAAVLVEFVLFEVRRSLRPVVESDGCIDVLGDSDSRRPRRVPAVPVRDVRQVDPMQRARHLLGSRGEELPGDLGPEPDGIRVPLCGNRNRRGAKMKNEMTSSIKNMVPVDSRCTTSGRLCAYQLVQLGKGCVS